MGARGYTKYRPSFAGHVEACHHIHSAAVRYSVDNTPYGRWFEPGERARLLHRLNADLLRMHLANNQAMTEADRQRAMSTITHLDAHK